MSTNAWLAIVGMFLFGCLRLVIALIDAERARRKEMQ
jgi:hypothetical protein